MLEISQGTSKSNLARARDILKKKIEVYKDEQKLQSL
jgi:DNA-directed RNA polymerase specialized sigma24 family protein